MMKSAVKFLSILCLFSLALALGACGEATDNSPGPVAEQTAELGDSDEAEEWEPCARAVCGDHCSVCPPNDDDCYETAVIKYCQPDGSCSPQKPDCSTEYDPCDGKVCGDYCSLCDPADRDCEETAVIKYCDADGNCTPTDPLCKESIRR